jgi:hypothetical protein
MKASELRIGNWVDVGMKEDIEEFGTDLHNVVVSEISTKSITYNKIGLASMIIVKPIPLTEEWLLKFGFVEDAQIFDIQYYEKQFLKAATLSIQLCNGICEKRNASIGYDLEWIFIGDIIYVHQLQNLYHALTGKELTI